MNAQERQPQARKPEYPAGEQEHATEILKQGGVHYTGDNNTKVAALLNVITDLDITPIGPPDKKGPTKGVQNMRATVEGSFVVVDDATDPAMKGAEYATDLRDAPEQLREAVKRAWQTLQENERAIGNQAPPALRAEFDAMRRHLQPIMEAMGALSTSDLTSESAVELKKLNPKELLRRAFGEVSEALREFVQEPGAFIVDIGGGQLAGMKLRELSRDGRTVSGVEIVAVEGDPGYPVGHKFTSDLSNARVNIRKGLEDSLQLKREIGLSDTVLSLIDFRNNNRRSKEAKQKA